MSWKKSLLFLLSDTNAGFGADQRRSSVELVRRFTGDQSRLSSVLLQDSPRRDVIRTFPATQLEIFPQERHRSDWLSGRQIQPIRRLDIQNLRASTFRQPEFQVIDVLGNNLNTNERNLNRVQVINDPRVVRQLLSRGSRARSAQANLQQPTVVRIPIRDRSGSSTSRAENTYLLLNQLTQPRTPSQVTAVNIRRPSPVLALQQTGSVASRSSASSSPVQAPIVHVRQSQVPSGEPTGRSSAQTVSRVVAAKQPVSSQIKTQVVTIASQPAGNVGVAAQPSPVQPVGNNLLYEELVNAFTEVLQQPAASQAAKQPASVQTAGHLGVQSYYPPQTGMPQFQTGFNGMHDPMGMGTFGNPYGFISPWMMDPATQQEMMFGDTTDPPNPVVETTTAAPTPTPAAVMKANASVVNIPSEPAKAVSSVTEAAPHLLTTGSQNTTSEIAVMATVSTGTDIPIDVVQTSAATMAAVVTTQLAPEATLPSAQITDPATKDLSTVSNQPTSAVPSLTTSAALPGHAKPALVSELHTMLSSSKLDAKVVEAAIKQAAAALGTLPPELEIIAKQFGVQIQQKAITPTSVPVQAETFPTLEQLGVTIPEPGKPVPKQSIQTLKGSTRGIVVYPPTAPTKLKSSSNHTVNASDINIVVVESARTLRKNLSVALPPDSVPTGNVGSTPTVGALPTFPPEGVIPISKQPEIYQTMKTVQEHNPLSIENAVKNKLSVKSLVDPASSGYLPTLEAMLVDISKGPTDQISVDINTKSSLSAAIQNGVSDNLTSLIAQEKVTGVPTTIDLTSIVDNTSSIVITDTMLPVHENQTVTDSVNSSDVLSNENQTVTEVDLKGLPVSPAKTLPVLSNVEGIPVSVEKIVPIEYNWSGVKSTFSPVESVYIVPAAPPVADATGALAILKELRNLKKITPKSTKSPIDHIELAKKLSDPAIVKALQLLLKNIGTQGKQSTTSASMTSPFVTSSNFFDVTTTSLPVTSTEEIELEDILTTKARARPKPRKRFG